MAHVPDAILDKLRCARCTSLLSTGPIAILSNGQSLCGRCTIPASNIFRAHAYEALAMYFLFPCKYWKKHCAYYLNWNEVEEHEAKCAFKSTCSIMFSNPGALFKAENKMDFAKPIKLFNIPEQVLESLTCSTCEYYLSSTPIFVNNEGKSSCHRCFKLKGGQVPVSFIQQYALEKILEIMLFPCVYRRRGCTHYSRFGLDTTSHEKDCSYGKVQRRPTKTLVDGKEKGVIETHSGHTYGTITPYTQMFVAQGKRLSQNYGSAQPTEMQDVFFNQLKKHRQNLEYKWRNSKFDGPPVEINIEKSSPNNVQGYDPEQLQTQTSIGSDSSQQFPSRYPEYGENSSPTNLQTPTSNRQASNQRAPELSQFAYPDGNLFSSGNNYRSSSQNSQSSSGESVGNYPQQLQVPKGAPNDPVSFGYFDRFERPNGSQRSGSFYNQYGSRSPPEMHRSDSVNRKGAAGVYPSEVNNNNNNSNNNFRY